MSSCLRVFVCCFVAWAALAATARAQAPQPDVTVRTSLDRTAIFVADRVSYTIELTCRRGVDVLADDLSRDKLKVEGLEIVDAGSDRESGPGDSTIYRFRYVLTTYRIDATTLKIAPLTVRYAVKRAGQRLEEAAPAGEVQVPGATVAFRSALPDDDAIGTIRSEKPAPVRPARFAALQPIGIALVILSAIPVLLAGAGLVRRARQPRVRKSMRAVRHDERASLESVRAMSVESADSRREVFTQLDALVRAHLREVCHVPGPSLTPKEVGPALAAAGSKAPPELVASILAQCELARYAPPHAIPSADACLKTMEQAEQVIAYR